MCFRSYCGHEIVYRVTLLYSSKISVSVSYGALQCEEPRKNMAHLYNRSMRRVLNVAAGPVLSTSPKHGVLRVVLFAGRGVCSLSHSTPYSTCTKHCIPCARVGKQTVCIDRAAAGADHGATTRDHCSQRGSPNALLGLHHVRTSKIAAECCRYKKHQQLASRWTRYNQHNV